MGTVEVILAGLGISLVAGTILGLGLRAWDEWQERSHQSE